MSAAEPTVPAPAIAVRQVKHRYDTRNPERPALSIAEPLEIMPGEVVIMSGPSGSGKTTLLTLIGGLRTLQEGSIQVLGRELLGLGREELVQHRRDIGFIFQRHNLLEALTAFQNVQVALQLAGSAARRERGRITELLTRLGLGDRLHYKPAQLSGGQRQRVAVARAVINRPRVILADEPTAALDAESGRTVVQLLKQLAEGEERCTSLLVTHDNRMLDVADRVVTLVDGELVANDVLSEREKAALSLTHFRAFAKLRPYELASIAEMMQTEVHADGAAIVRQGEPGDRLYFILQGAVDVIVDRGQPTERKISRLEKGHIFGEIALLSNEPRKATVLARGEVKTLSLGRAEFEAVHRSHPSFREHVLQLFYLRVGSVS